MQTDKKKYVDNWNELKLMHQRLFHGFILYLLLYIEISIDSNR